MSQPAPDQHILQFSTGFDVFLRSRILPLIQAETVPAVFEPVAYSLTAGGKRLRPFLVYLSAGMPESGPVADPVLFAGAAIECLHTYSLIHDDLPAMDNAALRRGRPSCHRAYSEWAAILAGDALNTLAFELLARGCPESHLGDLVRVLARGGGLAGMIAGQALDLTFEKQSKASVGDSPGGILDEIHNRKTAALIAAACEMGAVLQDRPRTAFAAYGQTLGLLFQVADDLLDVVGDETALGKKTGADAAAGKLTYPGVYGIDRTRARMAELCAQAEQLALALDIDPESRRVFASLPAFVAERAQ